jgi:hypothetical protein
VKVLQTLNKKNFKKMNLNFYGRLNKKDKKKLNAIFMVQFFDDISQTKSPILKIQKF